MSTTKRPIPKRDREIELLIAVIEPLLTLLDSQHRESAMVTITDALIAELRAQGARVPSTPNVKASPSSISRDPKYRAGYKDGWRTAVSRMFSLIDLVDAEIDFPDDED